MAANGNGIFSPRNPASVEAEVSELRDDVARILRELELRYHHLGEVPAAMRRQAVIRAKGPIPKVMIAGFAVVGMSYLLVRSIRRRRIRLLIERRPLHRMARRLDVWANALDPRYQVRR